MLLLTVTGCKLSKRSDKGYTRVVFEGNSFNVKAENINYTADVQGDAVLKGSAKAIANGQYVDTYFRPFELVEFKSDSGVIPPPVKGGK